MRKSFDSSISELKTTYHNYLSLFHQVVNAYVLNRCVELN